MKQNSKDVESVVNWKEKYDELVAQNEQLIERIADLELLNAINLSLSSTLDREETLESIRRFFQTTFILDQFSLMLRTGSKGELEVVSSFSAPFENGQWVELDENSIFSVVIHNKKPIYIPNGQTENRYSCSELFDNAEGSFLSLPLKLPPDHIIGVLNLHRKQIEAFSASEITRLSHLANHVASVIDKMLIFHQTKLLSITDPLTGIYNRRYFDERFTREMTRAVRYKRALSLLMIDIDHFKKYNDTLGHLMGDVALKRVACLLENKIRRADILARYGGEEFVVLLPEIQIKNARIVAEKLRAAVEYEKFDGEEKLPNKNVTISIGVASLSKHVVAADELIRLADEALYAAKRAGRNCVCEAGDCEKGAE
jgi:diguanylate cyclase (GGDEF)-like protein